MGCHGYSVIEMGGIDSVRVCDWVSNSEKDLTCLKVLKPPNQPTWYQQEFPPNYPSRDQQTDRSRTKRPKVQKEIEKNAPLLEH